MNIKWIEIALRVAAGLFAFTLTLGELASDPAVGFHFGAIGIIAVLLTTADRIRPQAPTVDHVR